MNRRSNKRVSQKDFRRMEEDRKRILKRNIIIALAAVAVICAAGGGIYAFTSNAREEQIIKKNEEKMASFENGLIENIDNAVELCPEVFEFVGENEISYKYFIDNIKSSDSLYDKAVNANSLIKMAAFYFDQYRAVDIEGVEAGGNGDVHFDSKTNNLGSELSTLRNDFTHNWYGYMGLGDAPAQTDDEYTNADMQQ